MPHNWESCFLLHARSFGDTSIIADIFTESSGKISIMAKGAKNPRSKFFGHLLPFSALNVIFTGKSEMKTLTHIDSNFVSQSIKGPHDLYTYLYVNELMIRLLPKGLPNQELYDLYQNFVELARADAISELDLRVFELDLLDVLGRGDAHRDVLLGREAARRDARRDRRAGGERPPKSHREGRRGTLDTGSTREGTGRGGCAARLP